MLWFGLLWPTFALVALVFAVWFKLFVDRVAHMRRSPPDAESFASSASAMRYFEPVEASASNLRNLFEMPVLFFALVPLLLVTRQADFAQVLLAWLFVLLRAAHSAVHIACGPVRTRFLVYLAGCVVLSAMWTGFFLDMLAAARLYHEVMAGMARP